MRKKILIVDDSRVSRMLLIAYMKNLRPEWTYDEAASGEAAMEIANKQVFDGISMDINMIGISGLDAARKIRQSQLNIKIVLVSANVQQAIRDEAKDIGVQFLQKPITEHTAEKIVEIIGE